MKSWTISKRHNLAVSIVPKCASQTIKEWLGPGQVKVKPDDHRLKQVGRRVAFIRNPIVRLVSAYSFFYWMDDYGMRSRQSDVPIKGWEPFVDYVLSDAEDDEHWKLQTDLIGDVANIYHRLENLSEHFEKYRPGILPYNNRCSHRRTSDYRRSEIIEKYAKDIVLWEKVY